MKQEWVDEIELRMPALYHLIHGARAAHSERMAGYLTFMSIRLIEMQRVLKRNGSIYLHCDDTAVHYLRPLMDALFGEQNYKPAITWQRTSAHNDSRRFGRILDNILFYSGRPRINADDVRVPLNPNYVRRHYRHEDERGVYRIGDLTAARIGTGETGQVWRGHDPNTSGRQWNAPYTGDYADWIDEAVIPGYKSIASPLARLDALDEAGLIYHPPDGKVPSLKRYLEGNPGRVPPNLWIDIRWVGPQSRERTGYPTQKPVALLERIIAASSDPGDLVLDPFCGCATACIAAEKLGRDWIGIDIAPQAAGILRDRARRELQIPLDDGNGNGWQDWTPSVLTAPTSRTDLELFDRADLQTIKETIYASQQGRCNGCKHAAPIHMLTIDHIVPRSKGGLDTASNLQLLCHTCNAIKGNRDMPYLRTRLRQLGILID